MRTTGKSTVSAPRERRAWVRGCVSCTGRVMTMRFPDRMDEECSATCAVNLLQDCTRTCLNQQLCEALAEFAGLVGGTGSALANVTAAVGRADDRVHGEFVPFEAGPRAERHLAAALQRAEKRTFRDDGLARFV